MWNKMQKKKKEKKATLSHPLTIKVTITTETRMGTCAGKIRSNVQCTCKKSEEMQPVKKVNYFSFCIRCIHHQALYLKHKLYLGVTRRRKSGTEFKKDVSPGNYARSQHPNHMLRFPSLIHGLSGCI